MLVSGYWFFKGYYPYFIQHQASSIQYLARSGINVCFHDFVNFGSGLPGLGSSIITSKDTVFPRK